MNIREIGDLYLDALYTKSENDFDKGFKAETIAKLINIEPSEAKNVIDYLNQKGLISLAKHMQDENTYLTYQGCDYVLDLRKNNTYKRLKFISVQKMPLTSVAGAEYIFAYSLTNNENLTEYNSIAVSISDVLIMNWGFNRPPYDKDFFLVRVLTQFAKEKIIKKLKEGILSNHEILVLRSNTYPDNPYNPEKLVDVADAEYSIKIKNAYPSDTFKHKELNSIQVKENKITIITRQQIFDEITISKISWSGRLEEPDFLNRIFDLSKLPSTDYRYSNAYDDIHKHRVMNYDWQDDWVFTDTRFNLLHCEEKIFLQFLCATIHPIIRTDEDEISLLLEMYNKYLKEDEYEIYVKETISNKSVYSARVIEGVTPEINIENSERRLALVIGCSEYENAGKLANPINDANGVVNSLKLLGFDVMVRENSNLKDLKTAIDDFGLELKKYEIGLFYFAGHGVQVKGLNYLIPIDANLISERLVEYDCVRADRVLAHMENSESKVNIVILDACRNNPFERAWGRNLSGNGLAVMDAPKGSLIAYSTAPGKTASDGEGNNGLYTGILIEEVVSINVPINQMFQKVRKRVMEKSLEQQIPWESTSLTADFYFNKPMGKNTLQSQLSGNAEIENIKRQLIETKITFGIDILTLEYIFKNTCIEFARGTNSYEIGEKISTLSITNKSEDAIWVKVKEVLGKFIIIGILSRIPSTEYSTEEYNLTPLGIKVAAEYSNLTSF